MSSFTDDPYPFPTFKSRGPVSKHINTVENVDVGGQTMLRQNVNQITKYAFPF